MDLRECQGWLHLVCPETMSRIWNTIISVSRKEADASPGATESGYF